ncbi:hypothetical protein BV25DRAFT_1469191 [Artomyces pyxidatus]|uniref:Uncharacterized protein n=1 Tax=Artomyces pyxidatus TaxID=48021 RepID=A0ACB8SLH6_9AGAM|nr:hypothetical protein BV25DRAFT_1469191 [Artomyces pyxidatus]
MTRGASTWGRRCAADCAPVVLSQIAAHPYHGGTLAGMHGASRCHQLRCGDDGAGRTCRLRGARVRAYHNVCQASCAQIRRHHDRMSLYHSRSPC